MFGVEIIPPLTHSVPFNKFPIDVQQIIFLLYCYLNFINEGEIKEETVKEAENKQTESKTKLEDVDQANADSQDKETGEIWQTIQMYDEMTNV